VIPTNTFPPEELLRDRIVGHSYAASAATPDSDDDTDHPLDALAEAATFKNVDDPTIQLYRAGLQAIRDGNRGIFGRMLKITWLRRDVQNLGTAAREYAMAAGVGYAAHLALKEDSNTTPDTVLDDIESAAVELSDAATGLIEAVHGGEPAVGPNELTKDIDPTDNPHGIDDLETLAYAQLLSAIAPDATEYYTLALDAMTRNEVQEVVNSFAIAWELRDDADEKVEERNATAAGVGLLAHVEMGVLQQDDIDLSNLNSLINEHRECLSDAVLAVYEAVIKGETAHSPDEFSEGINFESEDLNRNELEIFAFASLLNTLDEQDGADREDTDRENGEDDEEASEDSDNALTDLREKYRKGLEHTVEGDPTAAISPLMDAWYYHDSTSTEEGLRFALGAGVAAAVHSADDPGQSWLREEVEEGVSENTESLSEPVEVAFRATTGSESSPDITPDDLRESASELEGLASLEARAFAELLESATE